MEQQENNMIKSYRKRFKKIWDDKDAKANGLIHRISEGDVDALKEEKHNPKVIQDTKEMIE